MEQNPTIGEPLNGTSSKMATMSIGHKSVGHRVKFYRHRQPSKLSIGRAGAHKSCQIAILAKSFANVYARFRQACSDYKGRVFWQNHRREICETTFTAYPTTPNLSTASSSSLSSIPQHMIYQQHHPHHQLCNYQQK